MPPKPAPEREVFDPRHKQMTDGELLACPDAPLTELVLFTCTYVAQLGNLHYGFVDLTALLCAEPHGCLKAINSNFGHACQPGYEFFLKAPKPAAAGPYVPTRGRARKVQGDGTCFNSAIEPIVAINHPGIAPSKVYKIKCFPTTGEVQVPGVLLPDLSDGKAALESFVAYLNEFPVGDPAEDGTRKPVTVVMEQPKMLNYKFRIVRSSPRILVNLRALFEYLRVLEREKLDDTCAPRPDLFAGWPAAIFPPFRVRETKPSTDDVKVSFRFYGVRRSPRVNIFQGCKINILGAKSPETAAQIHDYFTRLIRANWGRLITLLPRRDNEPAPPPAVPPLTDAEFETVLDWISDGAAPAPAAPAPAPAAQNMPSEAELAEWDAYGDGSDDVMLGEVDGEDVEDDEEYPL